MSGLGPLLSYRTPACTLLLLLLLLRQSAALPRNRCCPACRRRRDAHADAGLARRRGRLGGAGLPCRAWQDAGRNRNDPEDLPSVQCGCAAGLSAGLCGWVGGLVMLACVPCQAAMQPTTNKLHAWLLHLPL